MEWYVYRYDLNSRKVVIFNIFNHSTFKAKVEAHLKKYDDKDKFAEKLRSELLYHYWSKYEWEIEISALHSKLEDKSEKVDVYSQVRLNWDKFVDYCWSFKKPKRQRKVREKVDDR